MKSPRPEATQEDPMQKLAVEAEICVCCTIEFLPRIPQKAADPIHVQRVACTFPAFYNNAVLHLEK